MHKTGTIKGMTPAKAIRAFCLECTGGIYKEVISDSRPVGRFIRE